MNRALKEVPVKRFHYDGHAQLRQRLADFIDAYNFGQRLKTLQGLPLTNASANSGHLSQIASGLIRSIKCRE
jgi:hypothetical protein